MTDYFGWRKKFGVITPSTNTSMQPELDAMRPAGVTNHTARMLITNQQTEDQAGFERMLREIDASLEDAVDRVMTCEPDHLILGISGEAVWGGGLEPSRKVRERIAKRTGGVGVTQPADALRPALDAYGVTGRVGIITPYHPSAEPHLAEYLEAIGCTLVRAEHIAHEKPSEIAQTTDQRMREAIEKVDGGDVEAIVQFGANLPMGPLAVVAERWLGKPVIAQIRYTYWHALRSNGIDDKIPGFGRLLAEF